MTNNSCRKGHKITRTLDVSAWLCKKLIFSYMISTNGNMSVYHSNDIIGLYLF